MRLLATADNHWDTHSRFSECQKVHSWMVDLARDLKIDLFLDAGDVFERASDAGERHWVADWIRRMAESADCVFAKGNHDDFLDAGLMRYLKAKHQVIVEEGAAVHYVQGAAIAAVAWPEPGLLLANATSLENSEAGAREALQDLFRGLGAELARHDGPRIGLGHLMVDGAVASTGQPLLGAPMNVGLSDLALFQAHLGIVGHIHARAIYDVFGVPWTYPGSPYRTDYGQVEPKSVVFAEFDGQKLTKLEQIETPAAPMLHVSGEWSDGGIAWDDLPFGVNSAEIRMRVRVPVDCRVPARAAAAEMKARWLADGAASVKVEEVVLAVTRARAPEVARASTYPEKLEAHWRSIAFDPGDRREELLRKQAQLEAISRAS